MNNKNIINQFSHNYSNNKRQEKWENTFMIITVEKYQECDFFQLSTNTTAAAEDDLVFLIYFYCWEIGSKRG